MTQQIVSANRLDTGRVVYLAPSDQWVSALSEAEVAHDQYHAEALLERATQAVRGCSIVDPYLIDLTAAAGSARPVRLRERIRDGGPTILDGSASKAA